jgi:hypothetical protein
MRRLDLVLLAVLAPLVTLALWGPDLVIQIGAALGVGAAAGAYLAHAERITGRYRADLRSVRANDAAASRVRPEVLHAIGPDPNRLREWGPSPNSRPRGLQPGDDSVSEPAPGGITTPGSPALLSDGS